MRLSNRFFDWHSHYDLDSGQWYCIKMKLFNYILEVNLRARHPWTHLKVHKGRDGHIGPVYYRHLVWGKLSVIFGQPHLIPIQVHKGCGAEATNLGEDGISYCTECETIVEGETEYITTEEYEYYS